MAKEILIADSDKADQEEFQRIFERTDYHIVFSESGEDVLLRVKLFKPDLIIAGTTLSEKNGLELCEALKADAEFKYIPFILLLNIFEEISDTDRKRLKVDGIISKPLHEGEVLNMVDRLLEGMETKGDRISGKGTEWKPSADMKKDDFALDEFDEKGQEEIIELMDVAEEPESEMRINDFAPMEKEEALREVASLDSWEKPEEEGKLPAEEGFVLSLQEEEEQEEISLPFGKEAAPEEVAPEEELFKKIDLEEILEKVEKMEFPSAVGRGLEREMKVFEEEPSKSAEPEEKLLSLEEFEAALQKGVDVEPLEEEPMEEELMEETLQPFSIEEPREKIPEEIVPIEMPQEEELDKLTEGEFREELLEKELEEEEIEEIEEPEKERIDLFEELEAPKAFREEMKLVEKPPTTRIEKTEEMEVSRFFEEEVRPLSRGMDKKVEKVVSERVQDMMEELIARHVPEMTKDILSLTIERIEKMVRDIVPDLAEKIIEEEIKRLEKGEKD